MTKERAMEHAKMQANWWIASATTGHTLQRRIFKFTKKLGDVELTDQEKIDDAMETAQTHMRHYFEIADLIQG